MARRILDEEDELLYQYRVPLYDDDGSELPILIYDRDRTLQMNPYYLENILGDIYSTLDDTYQKSKPNDVDPIMLKNGGVYKFNTVYMPNNFVTIYSSEPGSDEAGVDDPTLSSNTIYTNGKYRVYVWHTNKIPVISRYNKGVAGNNFMRAGEDISRAQNNISSDVKTINFKNDFRIPYLEYDERGHLLSVVDARYKLSLEGVELPETTVATRLKSLDLNQLYKVVGEEEGVIIDDVTKLFAANIYYPLSIVRNGFNECVEDTAVHTGSDPYTGDDVYQHRHFYHTAYGHNPAIAYNSAYNILRIFGHGKDNIVGQQARPGIEIVQDLSNNKQGIYLGHDGIFRAVSNGYIQNSNTGIMNYVRQDRLTNSSLSGVQNIELMLGGDKSLTESGVPNTTSVLVDKVSRANSLYMDNQYRIHAKDFIIDTDSDNSSVPMDSNKGTSLLDSIGKEKPIIHRMKATKSSTSTAKYTINFDNLYQHATTDPCIEYYIFDATQIPTDDGITSVEYLNAPKVDNMPITGGNYSFVLRCEKYNAMATDELFVTVVQTVTTMPEELTSVVFQGRTRTYTRYTMPGRGWSDWKELDRSADALLITGTDSELPVKNSVIASKFNEVDETIESVITRVGEIKDITDQIIDTSGLANVVKYYLIDSTNINFNSYTITDSKTYRKIYFYSATTGASFSNCPSTISFSNVTSFQLQVDRIGTDTLKTNPMCSQTLWVYVNLSPDTVSKRYTRYQTNDGSQWSEWKCISTTNSVTINSENLVTSGAVYDAIHNMDVNSTLIETFPGIADTSEHKVLVSTNDSTHLGHPYMATNLTYNEKNNVLTMNDISGKTNKIVAPLFDGKATKVSSTYNNSVGYKVIPFLNDNHNEVLYSTRFIINPAIASVQINGNSNELGHDRAISLELVDNYTKKKVYVQPQSIDLLNEDDTQSTKVQIANNAIDLTATVDDVDYDTKLTYSGMNIDNGTEVTNVTAGSASYTNQDNGYSSTIRYNNIYMHHPDDINTTIEAKQINMADRIKLAVTATTESITVMKDSATYSTFTAEEGASKAKTVKVQSTNETGFKNLVLTNGSGYASLLTDYYSTLRYNPKTYTLQLLTSESLSATEQSFQIKHGSDETIISPATLTMNDQYGNSATFNAINGASKATLADQLAVRAFGSNIDYPICLTYNNTNPYNAIGRYDRFTYNPYNTTLTSATTAGNNLTVQIAPSDNVSASNIPISGTINIKDSRKDGSIKMDFDTNTHSGRITLSEGHNNSATYDCYGASIAQTVKINSTEGGNGSINYTSTTYTSGLAVFSSDGSKIMRMTMANLESQLTTDKFRKITYGTSEPSSLNNGEIYLMYEN